MSSAEKIGKICSPVNDKTYEVKWNNSNGEVYVSYAGWSYVGKSKTADDALDLAINWLRSNS